MAKCEIMFLVLGTHLPTLHPNQNKLSHDTSLVEQKNAHSDLHRWSAGCKQRLLQVGRATTGHLRQELLPVLDGPGGEVAGRVGLWPPSKVGHRGGGGIL